MKSLMMFLQCVLADAGARCGVESTSRDYKTVAARVEHEGLSFLTITLPQFGKDFERSLADGGVGPDAFAGFGRRGELPRFLGGFLDLVFDRKTGTVIDVPSIEAIRVIRQITLVFGKIELPCSDARVERALKRYVDCDVDVGRVENYGLAAEMQFARISTLLFGQVLSDMDREVYYGELIPKHGPGSTADGLLGNEKYDLKRWTRRLDDVFPFVEYAVPYWTENVLGVNFEEPGAEMPVKVITVPKTLKTPRIIAVEPTHMQYMQQALLRSYTSHIAESNLLRKMVGTQDQTPNQRMARKGSIAGEYATLDLSDASDRVSKRHVAILLRNHPHLAMGVAACRTAKAAVDGHGVIPLAKFASMGSALCFPFESMVFLTLVFCGIEDGLRAASPRGQLYEISDRTLKSMRSQVRVYGDDMIVPARFAQPVVNCLETFGFHLNYAKSFWTGRFRESCGKEYYAGSDVSLTRIKHLLPSRRGQTAETVSMVEMRNRFFLAGGYPTVVEYLDSIMARLKYPYPEVGPQSPVLGRLTHGPIRVERMHPHTQSPLVKGILVWSKPRGSRATGNGALMKFFLNSGQLPEGPTSPFAKVVTDKDHLMFAGRPVAQYLKTGWGSPL